MSGYSENRQTWRSGLIVGLLVLVFLLVLGIAWQARQSSVLHDRAAVSVLRDYAGLAADEYARRAMAAVGYYGYFELVTLLRSSANGAIRLEDPNRVAEYVFRIDSTDLTLTPDAGLRPVARNYLIETLANAAREPLADPGFIIDHAIIDDQQQTFVAFNTEGAQTIVGFKVRSAWLETALSEVFRENTLLPASLAGGAVSNDLLYLLMSDSAGRALFETGTLGNAPVLVTRQLEDEYSGVFRGHEITVAMDPELAGSLVIGGLPGSRLPYTIALTVLAIALLFAGIWLVYRESAVARMRSNFVAEVSHELRTPLTQVRMFAESLLLGRLRTDSDRRRALTIINRESQRLIQMVENILSFSGRSRLATSEQDLAALIESVIDDFRMLADEKEIDVQASLEQGVTATVDRDAMRQVLINLLDNAVKYGPSGQTVMVSLRRTQGMVEIAVSDQGPGVPAADRERIWEPYFRLERERRAAVAGTGIGLAVVREIVNRLDGRAHVQDVPSGGARFVVELPG